MYIPNDTRGQARETLNSLPNRLEQLNLTTRETHQNKTRTDGPGPQACTVTLVVWAYVGPAKVQLGGEQTKRRDYISTLA